MNLIFDLDGTLIDARLRLYRLFQKLIPTSQLSYEDYWTLKQQKVSNETILAKECNFNVADIERFVADWMELIEAPEFLAFDKVFPDVREALERLGMQAKLHVCTARQSRQPVLNQLECFGLLPYFDSIMVTQQIRGKNELIVNMRDLAPQDWIIGDTGKDIQIGKLLGIRTCAVLSGFLSETSLVSYCPDLILPFASNFYL